MEMAFGKIVEGMTHEEVEGLLGKPGGKALISDFKNTAEYVEAFRAAGASATRSGMNWLRTFPPLRIVEVTKP